MRWNPSEVHDAIDEAESYIAILDHEGRMIDQESDPQEAYERAAFHSPTKTVMVDSNVWSKPARPNDDETRETLRDAVTRAVERSTIRPTRFDYESLGNFGKRDYRDNVDRYREQLGAVGKPMYARLVEEAAATVHGKGESQEGSIAKTWMEDWLDSEFLRENTKTAKVLARSDASYRSYGLNLLPHGAPFRSPFSTDTGQGPGGNTFCAHSTKECRLACLVNTGQRALTSGSFAASYIFSKLLLNSATTEAFLVNLYDRCVSKFVSAWRGKSSERMFLRLNVLSDLPWEVIAPGLLEAASKEARRILLGGQQWKWTDALGFYDYTKIPYRKGLPKHYDLTYSYSGPASRDPAADLLRDEPSMPRRMAVVFIERSTDLVRDEEGRESYYAGDPGLRLKQESARFFKFKWFGWPVFNGDNSDIRPLDPADVRVVGLAYKVSRYKVWAEAGELTAEGKQKQFGLKNFVQSDEIDAKLPTFMVRVHRPDPDGPPVVVSTQDPSNRQVILPLREEVTQIRRRC
jgi:hypothetical protein